MGNAVISRPDQRTFLGRLRRDASGNTLAMMAISLVPISALAGSAVDMARLYVVKVRLQQACDAGALAGRKFMADNESTALDTPAANRAREFFGNNFKSGWMKTGTAVFTPTKTPDRQVAGTASVPVPMTVMKMFAAPDVTLNVTCEARYDVADTDIMFVLDTTGSMACPPEMSNSDCSTYVYNNPSTAYTRPSSNTDAVAGYLGSTSYAVPESTGAGGSRIGALRQAVKDFYATVAANVDASTHIRYGFVTYTSTVNAGKAILDKSPSYLVGGTSGDSWTYQSRVVTGEYEVSELVTNQNNNKSQTGCTQSAKYDRTPSAVNTFSTPSGTAIAVTQEWNPTTGKCMDVTRTLGPVWTYKPVLHNVSSFVTSASVTDPSKVTGATTSWDGCIEERATEAGVTSFTTASKDLDPTLVPSNDITTRWKPMWADVVYGRNQKTYYNPWTGRSSYYYDGVADDTTKGDVEAEAPSYALDGKNQSGAVSCGKPVHRLSEMTSAQVAAYVDAADFKALGGTYHDTGMIWGTRMLAPNGIFGSDTAPWSGRPAPKRVLVFLTDGNMAPNQTVYGMYGFEYFDRRVSAGDLDSLTDYHNARFAAECVKARALGIDVWTVAIGMDTTPELTSCASSSAQALDTTTGTGLSDAFKKIAKQVAMLRLSR